MKRMPIRILLYGARIQSGIERKDGGKHYYAFKESIPILKA